MGKEKVASFVTTSLLGVDPNERYAHQPEHLEKRAHEILDPIELYLEDEPSVLEWFKELIPTARGATQYVYGLFPPITWLKRYNMQWLLGDVIAGITIGLVVVPQAMAYALLAQLKPAFGLYTSFTGAVLYWVFGTSKDIVIGTTAIGSLLVGQVISHVDENAPGKFSHEETAHMLSMLAGCVLLFFGLFRLGWIIEFIPYIPISAFVTAASVTIMSTQIPTALGIPGIDTREPPYKVLLNTVKHLPSAQMDASIGITALVLLFALRSFCSTMEAKRPAQKRMWAFLSSLRLTFTILLFTFISFLVNRKGSKFRIVGKINSGFREAGLPHPKAELAQLILPELPAVVIILVIEHIAIAKAMGRLHNYTVNPSQEIVALGGANLLSPFVGGYVCTGSFGASAVLSKAGSRTPLAGLFSAMVLVLALYALTGVFYYIPNAALSGLIIHAVFSLITPPNKVYKYWQLSPLEFLVWLACLIMALFKSLEFSIYVGVGLSVALLLIRVARTKGQFLGQVRVERVSEEKRASFGAADGDAKNKEAPRTAFIPTDRKRASNPAIKVESPYPGVFIYRLSEGYNFTNQAFHVEGLLSYIMRHTRRTSEDDVERESDRLWNDPGPQIYNTCVDSLPYLRTIVLDFAAVNNVDVTSLQGLIDLRNSFDRYAAPDSVEWHFANVHNRWTRRALACAGFGYPTSQNEIGLKRWKPIYSIADTLVDDVWDPSRHRPRRQDDEPGCRSLSDSITSVEVEPRRAALSGVDRPFFHVDLHDAVEAAVRDARSKDKHMN